MDGWMNGLCKFEIEEGWIDGWISEILRLDGWISVSLR